MALILILLNQRRVYEALSGWEGQRGEMGESGHSSDRKGGSFPDPTYFQDVGGRQRTDICCLQHNNHYNLF